MPPFLYPFWWSDVSYFQRQCCCWCFKALSPCLWLNPLSFAAFYLMKPWSFVSFTHMFATSTLLLAGFKTSEYPLVKITMLLMGKSTISMAMFNSNVSLPEGIFAGLAGFTSQFGVMKAPETLANSRWDPRLRVWRAPPPRSTVLGSRSAARSPRDGPGWKVGGPENHHGGGSWMYSNWPSHWRFHLQNWMKPGLNPRISKVNCDLSSKRLDTTIRNIRC